MVHLDLYFGLISLDSFGVGRLGFHPSFAVERDASTEYNLANEAKHVNVYGERPSIKVGIFVTCAA